MKEKIYLLDIRGDHGKLPELIHINKIDKMSRCGNYWDIWISGGLHQVWDESDNLTRQIERILSS